MLCRRCWYGLFCNWLISHTLSSMLSYLVASSRGGDTCDAELLRLFWELELIIWKYRFFYAPNEGSYLAVISLALKKRKNITFNVFGSKLLRNNKIVDNYSLFLLQKNLNEFPPFIEVQHATLSLILFDHRQPFTFRAWVTIMRARIARRKEERTDFRDETMWIWSLIALL